MTLETMPVVAIVWSGRKDTDVCLVFSQSNLVSCIGRK